MNTLEVKKEIRKFAAITRLHHAIDSVLEIEEIVRILVRELIGLLACEGCAILLIDGNKVKVLPERGFSKIFNTDSLSIDLPAIQYILNIRQSLIAEDVLNSPAVACVPFGCAKCSLICTPIVLNGDIRGIIHLDSQNRDYFSREDLEFVELIQREISFAIERSYICSMVKDMSIRDGLTTLLSEKIRFRPYCSHS